MQIRRGKKKKKKDRGDEKKRPFLLRHIKKSMNRCLIRPVTNMVSLWIIFLYDIDKDGVKELLLLNGTCEADYVYKIYTIGNGSARYIDEVNGSCVMFYEDENGGTEKYIIRCAGSDGM